MTRKDFELVAKILTYTEVKDKDAITSLLQATNPAFNSDRFWKAVED